MEYTAYSAASAGAQIVAERRLAATLGPEEIEIAVEHCGICHSDMSMLDNEWGFSVFPLVAGHEAVGRVVAVGSSAKRVAVGDRVGLGWQASACMACAACLSGKHQLCAANQPTIVGRDGGFAERVRCHWALATKLPDGMDAASAGPLFCGGITVFQPMVEFGLSPLARVAVIGIGGLGHIALQFLRAWGCEVTALTSSTSKEAEAHKLGAHKVVVNKPEALKALTGKFDMVLVTANAAMDWEAIIATLAPNGRLHFVGAVLEPVKLSVFSLLGGQKSVSGSPIGSPSHISQMLDFAVRHGIAPQIERYPVARINDALAHLRAGKARYRVVLDF